MLFQQRVFFCLSMLSRIKVQDLNFFLHWDPLAYKGSKPRAFGYDRNTPRVLKESSYLILNQPMFRNTLTIIYSRKQSSIQQYVLLHSFQDTYFSKTTIFCLLFTLNFSDLFLHSSTTEGLFLPLKLFFCPEYTVHEHLWFVRSVLMIKATFEIIQNKNSKT